MKYWYQPVPAYQLSLAIYFLSYNLRFVLNFPHCWERKNIYFSFCIRKNSKVFFVSSYKGNLSVKTEFRLIPNV